MSASKTMRHSCDGVTRQSMLRITVQVVKIELERLKARLREVQGKGTI